MIVLTSEDLPGVLAELGSYRPRSLQMESMVRNRINNKYTWPGIEFVADQLQNWSVIFSRPVKDSQDYIPWPRSACHLIFCNDVNRLRQLCREDGFTDWSKPSLFFGISKHDVYPVIAERCSEVGESVNPAPSPEESDNGNMFILDPKTVNLNEYTIPPGYRLGTLTADNAAQVNLQWHYGSDATLPFFRHLIEHFPNSAVFKESTGDLVAYILYQPDGCLGHGFVTPEHRRKGLFRVVNYDCAKKVIEQTGQPVAWVYVMKWNEVSRSAYKRMGAVMVDDEVLSVEWIAYRPKKP